MTQLKPLRIIFFGTTHFAARHLHALINSALYQIVAIFTTKSVQKSKYDSTYSIENIAKKHNLLLFQYSKITIIEIVQIIKKLKTDLIIVVSCRLIFPKEILNLPKLGCINVHGSLLPRWKGPAPIQRALEYGDTITGISIIKMNEKIDSGEILTTEVCNIHSQDTTQTLSKKLAKIGATALLNILEKLKLNTHQTVPQNLTSTKYAYKLTKKEARIDWKKSAQQLERCIRAFNPWPVCFFPIKNTIIKIWAAEIDNQNKKNYSNSNKALPGTILISNKYGIHILTGHGILILTILQIAGKKKMAVREILNSKKTWFIPQSMLK